MRYFPDITHTNQHWRSDAERYRGKTLNDIFLNQQEIYKAKIGRKPMLEDRKRLDKKTGKMKTIAGWSPIREMVVIIKPNTQLEDFDKVREWFSRNGVGVISIDLHFDEGHIDKETEERKINNHAHVVLDWIDYGTGKTAKLDKEKMRELQTVLADALGMERGEIKDLTNAEHLDQAEYRARAQAKENKKIAEKNAALKAQSEELMNEVAELEAEKILAEKKAVELKAQVGFGAKVGAFFGVGELAEIHKEAEKAVEEERKKWEAEKEKIIIDAKKAISAAEKKADEQLSTERRTIEQRAFLVAKETILSTAGLMEMQGKVPTLREIGDYFGKKCKEVTELGRKVLQLQGEVERLTARIEVEKENELIWALGLMPGTDRRNIPKEKTAENIVAFFQGGIGKVIGRVGRWLERQGLSIEEIDAEERRREWQEKFQKNEDIKEDLAEENRRGHRRF